MAIFLQLQGQPREEKCPRTSLRSHLMAMQSLYSAHSFANMDPTLQIDLLNTPRVISDGDGGAVVVADMT
jgi:hypothetical protein